MPLKGGIMEAERQGFEPWDPGKGVNGFRDRPIRPLWHLSSEWVTGNLDRDLSPLFGGERGIRTPGPSQVNGFQDRRNRPLCHLSGGKSNTFSGPGKGGMVV